MQKILSVLVLSPHPKTYGGVSTFVETMKDNLRCHVTSFWIGKPLHKKENLIDATRRLIVVPLKVWRMVRRQHFDVVHIHPSLDMKSVIRDGLILLALRIAKHPRTLISFHGWQKRTERMLRQLPGARSLLNGAGRITVLAPEFKHALEQIGVHKERVLVSRTMFDGKALCAANDANATSRRTILFLSRFERSKGMYELLDAFARIADEFPDVDLVMAGDGEEKSILHKCISNYGLTDRVLLTGYVTGAAKAALLNSCTVFALPTYYAEGMPVALLEAMGAGKPVLTANAGGLRHIVKDQENGVVLSRVTVDAVTDGLRRLLGNKPACDEMGRHNATYAWAHFEASPVTADIESLYHDIARLP